MLSSQKTGLRLITDLEDDITKLIRNPTEWFALEAAKEYNATGVYFRRFPNRQSIPQAYIYDYTLSSEALIKMK